MRTLCWNWQLPWNGDFLKVPQVQQTSMLKNCTQCIVKSLWIFFVWLRDSCDRYRNVGNSKRRREKTNDISESWRKRRPIVSCHAWKQAGWPSSCCLTFWELGRCMTLWALCLVGSWWTASLWKSSERSRGATAQGWRSSAGGQDTELKNIKNIVKDQISSKC